MSDDAEYSQDEQGNKITSEGLVPKEEAAPAEEEAATPQQEEQQQQQPAEEEHKEEPPAPPANEKPNEEACGACCCQAGICPFTGGACPIENPDTLQKFLESHLVWFQRVQEVLLLRRPVVLAVAFVALNLVFFLYRKLNLNFYALATLILLLYTIYQAFVRAHTQQIIDSLFASNVDQGDANSPTRVRNPKEVSLLVSQYLAWLPPCGRVVYKLYSDQSTTGRLIWIGILFCVFLLVASVDFFWPLVLLCNAALLSLPIYCVVITQTQKPKAD